MKLFKFLLVIIVCVLTPVLLYVVTPEVNEQTIKLSETKVAIVNEDEGVYKGDEYYNYAEKLSKLFMESSEFDAIITNSADASTLLAEGQLMYVVTFKKDFSKDIDNFDTENPKPGKVEYHYNHAYNTANGNLLSEQERNRLFSELQDELSIIYTKTIINEVQDSKEMLLLDLENKIKLTSDVKDTGNDNATKLTEILKVSSQQIGDFDNQTNDRIMDLNQSLGDVNMNIGDLLALTNDNISNFEDAKHLEETNNQAVISQYNLQLSKYRDSTTLSIGDEGILTKLVNYYIPVYQLYDDEYKENIKVVSSLTDNSPSLNLESCESEFDINDFSSTVEELETITLQSVDLETNQLISKQALTSVEIEQLISNAYGECQSNLQEKAEQYSIGDSSNINILWSTISSHFISDIKEAGLASKYDYNIVYDMKIIDGEEQPEDMVLLSALEVDEYNSLRKLFSIIEGRQEPEYVEVIENAFIDPETYSSFVNLKHDVLIGYIELGGEFNDVTQLVDSGYGIESLAAQDGSGLRAIQSEYVDMQKEIFFLHTFVNDKFNETLKNNLLNEIMAKILGREISHVGSLTSELSNEVDSSAEITKKLLAEYEEEYQTSLVKLSDNSKLTVQMLENTEEKRYSIIEQGEIVLSSNQLIPDLSENVMNANDEVNEMLLAVIKMNTDVNDQIEDNNQKYVASIQKIEETNNANQEFIDEYAEVLDNANIEGVNNNKFYSFISEPISYERLEINNSQNVVGSYFIVFWIFIGLISISLIKDSKNKYLQLNISSGSFHESVMTKFINNYLLTILVVGGYSVLFSVILVNKFSLENGILFTLRLSSLLVILFIVFRLVVKSSKKIGYAVLFVYFSTIYIVIYTEKLPVIIKYVVAPITSLNNFILYDIYNIEYSYAYAISLIVLSILCVALLVINVIISNVKKRR